MPKMKLHLDDYRGHKLSIHASQGRYVIEIDDRLTEIGPKQRVAAERYAKELVDRIEDAHRIIGSPSSADQIHKTPYC